MARSNSRLDKVEETINELEDDKKNYLEYTGRERQTENTKEDRMIRFK